MNVYPIPPVCDVSLDLLPQLALKELAVHHALTGAQRKISAYWSSNQATFGEPRR
jgi:hypothetical protein